MVSVARLAAPWYVHPASNPQAWATLPNWPLSFAVVNVANGPGPASDPYYPTALAPVVAQGPKLLGYVDVAYGRCAAMQVLGAAAQWRARYGVTGLMLDQVPATPDALGWTTALVAELRAQGGDFIALNPGTPVHPDLVAVSDVCCVIETDWFSYLNWRPPAALREVPPAALWHLVHGCPGDVLDRLPQLAAARGAGLVWGTPGRLPNPWAVLPALPTDG